LLTKLQARSLIRDFIDDAQGKRWSDGSLDVLTQTVVDELWSDVLDMAPWVVSQYQTVSTIVSPGYIDLRTTDAGGVLSQRLYRIQKIYRAKQEYVPASQHSGLVDESDSTAVSVPDRTYAQYGSQLWLYPLDAVTVVGIRYNYLPSAYSLFGDGATVPFVDGFDSVYTHEVAARALIKGDAENMQQHKTIAEQAKGKMLAAISNYYVGPKVPIAVDNPISWGSI
jgi:hypothetical protein